MVKWAVSIDHHKLLSCERIKILLFKDEAVHGKDPVMDSMYKMEALISKAGILFCGKRCLPYYFEFIL